MRLPPWSRWLLALVPLRDRRAEVEADFTELFFDRSTRYGRGYAARRLAIDIVSIWHGVPKGGHMFQDVRFGFRLFRKHPLPIGLAIGGLALATGVVTSAFSVINATMLRPYGMDNPTAVVQITRPSFGDRFRPSWPYARFLHMKEARSLAYVEASMHDTARLSPTPDADTAPVRDVHFVSGGYLEMLGGRAALGRTLQASDDMPAAAPVLVISHDLFGSLFGGDSSRIGSTVWLAGKPATLVGVLRPGFSAPSPRTPQVWVPFAAFDDLIGLAESYTVNGRTPASMQGDPFGPTARTQVEVIGRLAQGVPTAAAAEDVAAVVNRLASTQPGASPTAKPTVVRIFGAARPIDGPDAAEAWLQIVSMLGIVALVLLIACINAANLLLAAAATRVREIGVRLALGASGGRLLRQMTTESLSLATLAGGVGLLLAWWLSPVVGAIVGAEAHLGFGPDARVLAFATLVAVVCGLGVGIAPARFGARGNVSAALQSQAGATGRANVRSRLRSSFIGLQAAMSMLLLAAAALLARTALHTEHMDVGFDVDRIVTVSVTTPAGKVNEPVYFQRALDAVRAIPSVEHVGLMEIRPFGMTIDTIRLPNESDGYRLYMNRIDADVFGAAGIRLLQGRAFTTADVASGAAVAVISDSVARRYFGGRNPIGQTLSAFGVDDEDGMAVIVGIAADAMLNRVHTEGFGTVYRPLRTTGAPGTPLSRSPPALIVRAPAPRAVAREVEQVLRRLDDRVRPTTWLVRDAVDEFSDGKRMLAWLSAPMALLALLLATMGVYGVTTFVASRRTQEVSVRMALGASAADVRRLLVREGLRPVLVGLIVGLAVALGAARIFASVLPGVSPHDPLSLGLAVGVLLSAAGAAVLLPARKAARLDPARILRES